ncbi:unnamed protein product, partial [Polarella glacialis]
MVTSEVWKRFSPAQIDHALCMARTWSGGLGGQCPRQRQGQKHDFCSLHDKKDGWKVHGRVDDAIPEKKLKEFERSNGSGAKKSETAAPSSRPKKRPAEGSEVGGTQKKAKDSAPPKAAPAAKETKEATGAK